MTVRVMGRGGEAKKKYNGREHVRNVIQRALVEAAMMLVVDAVGVGVGVGQSGRVRLGWWRCTVLEVQLGRVCCKRGTQCLPGKSLIATSILFVIG